MSFSPTRSLRICSFRLISGNCSVLVSVSFNQAWSTECRRIFAEITYFSRRKFYIPFSSPPLEIQFLLNCKNVSKITNFVNLENNFHKAKRDAYNRKYWLFGSSLYWNVSIIQKGMHLVLNANQALIRRNATRRVSAVNFLGNNIETMTTMLTTTIVIVAKGTEVKRGGREERLYRRKREKYIILCEF